MFRAVLHNEDVENQSASNMNWNHAVDPQKGAEKITRSVNAML